MCSPNWVLTARTGTGSCRAQPTVQSQRPPAAAQAMWQPLNGVVASVGGSVAFHASALLC